MNILVTGGNGYIAQSIYRSLSSKFNITLVTRVDFDLTDTHQVRDWFVGKYFDVLIHTAVVGGSRFKAEDSSIFLENILMYDNLLQCRKHYDLFIHFGSGAEFQHSTPYGFSKYIISKLITQDPRSINVRIFAVFDENELDTRFIKSSILRYLRREELVVLQDRKMDFFYMRDLLMLLEWLMALENESLLFSPINCSYPNQYSLKDIANIIDGIDTYQVGVKIVSSTQGEDYCGQFHELPLTFYGLTEGIHLTYSVLKDNGS
ncbi:MAG: NAD(P)-dependent oxidoreductase [Saprospiraceae bacterium]|jgi:UDP-glucose 4-epimerase|nr:NAD(P)-dependent oxidoreductase [Saprospiraceae bacterium]